MARSLTARSSGFTIVELLIVIVVIGILAVIAIGAFTRAQEQARAATVQSDLKASAKQLEQVNVETGTYPTNGNGLPASPNTGYQYAYDAATNTYCLTGTNGASSFKVTSTNKTPVTGGCPGHGVGGVAAITNMIINPSAEVNTSNISGYFSGTRTLDNTRAVSGTYSVRTDTNSATNAQGAFWATGLVATAGTQYSCSISVSGTPGTNLEVSGRVDNGAGNYLSEAHGMVTVGLTDSWQRVNFSFVAPANTGRIHIQYKLPTAISGRTIWADAAMCVAGSGTYNFADGNSANWIWNGTANNASSTGPPL
ncbi:prepilin-type N-terminal cleavage/methylation domain-containing protein [Candidatus Saccharibacteria bacterium]|nr:prepilin-type N-terminal cleavage/methylation domain-containing protein [Candidatus Saccharibacteria bacterium]